MKDKLLFVEDDETFRGVLTRELISFGYEVKSVAKGELALEVCGAFRPDLALVDLRLPGIGGLAVVEQLVAQDADIQAVVLTGHGTVTDAVAAMRLGAFDFLEKPVALDVLEQTLTRAMEHRSLLQENQRLRSLVGRGNVAPNILGRAPATEELRRLVARIAPSDAGVLIEGENGTGKELVARAIHSASPRSKQPFVVVNCGAIPETLVESELFGHERGAFTGADNSSMGLFAAAHGGTLFLDEVGELPLSVQPVLLRALQFGEIRPLGSGKTCSVDCRVLAATNRSLEHEQEEGRFREDLYYRLATLIIRVPPLRERREDVEELLRLFMSRAALGQDSDAIKSLSPEAIQLLAAHDWPGNVRELENAVVRLNTLADTRSITVKDVERYVLKKPAADQTSTAAPGLPTLDMETLERMAVEAALATHSGNRAAAAAELGLSVKTLYNKIRRFGIELPRR